MAVEIRSAPHRKIAVADILPNPHRDMQTNPVSPEKVEALIESFKRTGFWDNIVVRPHPKREGKYELAYGHGRWTALKKARIAEITIPVAKLTDWQMFQAMVDENETQATITPAIVFENIGVGARLIEQYAKESETPEEFAEHFGSSAPGGGSSVFDARGFGMIKARIERGEGPGRDVLTALVPSAKVHNATVTAVLDSIYGKAREAAKTKAAEAHRATANAKRKKAEAQKDEARAEKLLREAEEADREAAEFEKEAAKLARSGVDKEALLMMPSPTHIAEFAQAVRRLGIPMQRHIEAARKVADGEWSKRDVAPKLSIWWDVAGGAAAARQRAAEHEKKLAKLKKMVAGGDLSSFLVKLDGRLKDLDRDLRIAADYVQYASPSIRNAIVRAWPPIAELISTVAERAGSPVDAKDITPEKPKMLAHH